MRKEDKGKTGMQSVKGGVYSKMQEKKSRKTNRKLSNEQRVTERSK